MCELDGRKMWLLFVLVLMSTPFHSTVGYGQSDALALMAMSLWAVVGSQSGRGLLLGIAYEKYSFPPVLVVFLLLRKRWKLLIFSLFPPVLGFLFVDAWLRTSWQTLALEPFRTAVHKGGVVPGSANIAVVTERILLHVAHAPPWTRILPYGLSILLACVIAAYFAKNGSDTDGRIILACTLGASLACFPHLSYDWLGLIFCVAIAIKSTPSNARNMVFLLAAYFWYLERIPYIFRRDFHLYILVPNFFLLLVLIAATYQLRNKTKWSSPWEI